jgi:hypothetical protein
VGVRAWDFTSLKFMSGEREIMVADLEHAAHSVAEGERHIALQRQIIDGLKRRRGPGNSDALKRGSSSLRKNPEAVPLFSPVRADGFGGLSIVGGALACLIAVNYAATSLGMRIRL